jgi:hypothetical protein
LGEKISRNKKRTIGANFTSADAAVLFARSDNKRQILLIEWKYTESYGRTSLKIASSGIDRTTIYQPLLDRMDCPLELSALPGIDTLFYMPFDQLMRQQLLAHEMECAHELAADIVSVLHIAPMHNRDFRRITSPALSKPGKSAIEVWQRLLRKPDRFVSVSTEEMFGPFVVDDLAALNSWRQYITTRYRWLSDSLPQEV